MTNTHPLKRIRRPAFERPTPRISNVDLFAGMGGLTLGLAMAAYERRLGLTTPLAIDFEHSAVEMFARNFPEANVRLDVAENYFDSTLGARRLSAAEKSVRTEIGAVDFLVGGPPCQGHSNLNNHTRRKDPKNRLYLRMVRAAEVLEPAVVLIENVPAVRHDHENVVGRAMESLERADYVTAAAVLPLVTFGVPQNRKRHVLLGVRADLVDDESMVAGFIAPGEGLEKRTLKWAISDLLKKEGTSPMDTASKPSPENLERMKWLLAHPDEYNLPNDRRPKCHQRKHSYTSMYGRMRWDEPAPTITGGFNSMGRGRFMHPKKPRCMTPHEAMRCQGFPDYFRIDVDTITRQDMLTAIGNAVPPQMSEVIAGRIIDAGIV